MSGGAPACGAAGALSPVHLDALARLAPAHPGALREVIGAGPELRCALEPHPGPHRDVLHEGPPGAALWARWGGTAPDAVVPVRDCPAEHAGEGCGHYASHPGGHTWTRQDPEETT
ncbi:hypothetical protein [Streptomyces sp. NBC_00503]|uniref:hypothetical protein n=1 Tax=Streptomyces sp. NBC_00503 TaxID=2903659 RepID=UPI002E7FFA83|nr:hypothetical protein [Streptomyces sp. NBC_00503]WUD83007.1 hypothetical protein OG490_22010 [Streptomyces sp. NBC_00503]